MKTQHAICTIRNPKDGAHDLSELNAALKDGAGLVVQTVSDCASAIVFIVESGQDDPPPASQ